MFLKGPFLPYSRHCSRLETGLRCFWNWPSERNFCCHPCCHFAFLTLKYTLQVISEEPALRECFGPLIFIHSHQAIQTRMTSYLVYKWLVVARIPLQIHSHHQALSATPKMLLMVFFNCSSRSLRVRRSELPAKTQHQTVTGSQWDFQPLF